jgi:hypothetical protein
MKRIDRLKRTAVELCNKKGHSMSSFRKNGKGDSNHIARCYRCHKHVSVGNSSPSFILGPAIHVSCDARDTKIRYLGYCEAKVEPTLLEEKKKKRIFKIFVGRSEKTEEVEMIAIDKNKLGAGTETAEYLCPGMPEPKEIGEIQITGDLQFIDEWFYIHTQ